MRYSNLTKEERETLEEGFKNHPKLHVRKRFHSILLSDEGWQVKAISELYKQRTRTIYSWMNNWRDFGLAGLMIKPGRGLKPHLSIYDKNIVETVKKNSEMCQKSK